MATRQLELRISLRGRLLAMLASTSLLVVMGCHSSAAGSATNPAAAKAVPSGTSPGTAAAAPLAGRPPYSAAVSQLRADPDYPGKGTTGVDTLHYGLDLTWDSATRELSGTATIRFRATRKQTRMSLDLGSPLHVDAVTIDGRAVHATHLGQKLSVATGVMKRESRHTLVVRYHGKPDPAHAPTTRPDIPGVGWTVEPDGEVWTIQEPFGAFTWYPVNDQPSDKAFYDVTVHTKSAWTAVSNGTLVSDRVSGAQRAMHWHLASPASSYLVTIAIGPYRDYHQTGPHGLPLNYWVRNSDKSVLPGLRHTPAMLRWLEARLGRYPFDRLGDVVVPTPSGEETQTMVTIGAGVLDSSVGQSDLLHEYSHQWYGDTVTPNNWKDLWLNESFAMYIQFTWEASQGVTTTAAWQNMVNRDDQSLRTKYGPPGEYDRKNFAELNVYYCGARMLDRLHTMLGPTLFAKVLRDWPHLHRFGSADRGEWIRYLDKTTGRNLRPFVHLWLTSKVSPA